jgi:hypothetical protein
MSAYTWTNIRASIIDRETALKYCQKIKEHCHGIWYYDAYINNQDTAFERWKKLHIDNKKYFMDCGFTENDFKDSSLKQSLFDNYMQLQNAMDLVKKFEDNEITFSQLLEDEVIDEVLDCDEFDNEKFVKQIGEIFRLRQYDELDLNLHTVDSLVEYLKQPKCQGFLMDFSREDSEYGDMTPELEAAIRLHYGRIGDNNFIVNFG